MTCKQWHLYMEAGARKSLGKPAHASGVAGESVHNEHTCIARPDMGHGFSAGNNGSGHEATLGRLSGGLAISRGPVHHSHR